MGNKINFECKVCYQPYRVKKKRNSFVNVDSKECPECCDLSEKNKKRINRIKREERSELVAKHEEKLRDQKSPAYYGFFPQGGFPF